jgi:hypothetical protein
LPCFSFIAPVRFCGNNATTTAGYGALIRMWNGLLSRFRVAK